MNEVKEFLTEIPTATVATYRKLLVGESAGGKSLTLAISNTVLWAGGYLYSTDDTLIAATGIAEDDAKSSKPMSQTEALELCDELDRQARQGPTVAASVKITSVTVTRLAKTMLPPMFDLFITGNKPVRQKDAPKHKPKAEEKEPEEKEEKEKDKPHHGPHKKH